MRILVVEDVRKVAGFIEMGLREEGYAVDVAKDGDEATALAHINDYDAILLDLMLPQKKWTSGGIRASPEGRSTPILMLTARNATEDIVRGLNAGADDYLTKPFRFDELSRQGPRIGTPRRGRQARPVVVRFDRTRPAQARGLGR